MKTDAKPTTTEPVTSTDEKKTETQPAPTARLRVRTLIKAGYQASLNYFN